MKRVLSIIIALAIILSCSVPAFAQAKCSCEHSPVVVISGMGATPMIQDRGTPNEKEVFPPESIDIPSLVSAILKGLSESAIYNDWNYFADAAIPEVRKILEPIACNPDGTSKHNVTSQQYDKSMAEYPEEEVYGTSNEFGLLTRLSKIYGADHVYFYNYNWRMDPMDHAKELNNLVKTIKTKTGHNKVTMVSCSMGGAITMAYLSQYGNADLDGCIFLSTVFFGTFIASELFTKQIAFNPSGLTRLIAGMDTGSKTINAILKQLMPAIKEAGLIDVFCALLNNGINVLKDRVYDELLIDIFGTMPGLWAVVDADHYNEAKKLMLDENENAELIKKIDVFHKEVSLKKTDILKSLHENNVKIAILANYNTQNTPIYPSSARQGDSILETELVSAGATCAKLGETLPQDYINSRKVCSCGLTHISPDFVIDASTCMFPEYTWFGKDWPHVCGNVNTAYTDLIMWIISYDGQPTVHSDLRCPQFFGNDHNGNITNLQTQQPLPRGLKWFDSDKKSPDLKYGPLLPQKLDTRNITLALPIKGISKTAHQVIDKQDSAENNSKIKIPDTGISDSIGICTTMLFALCISSASIKKKKR